MNTGNFKTKINDRRSEALDRLIIQLSSGMKQEKGTTLTLEKIELTNEDISRINKEISVLKSRIVSHDIAASTRTKKDRSGSGKYRR